MNRKLLIAVIATSLTMTLPSASAASKQPTPSSKASASSKVVEEKASVKPTPAKKKAPAKKKKKKIAKLSPSPSPKWPPVGFKTDAQNESKIYLKVPTTKELVGILSAKSSLAAQIKACTQFTCGAVLIASEIGCRWWQIKGDVIGATSVENRAPKLFGKIVTSINGSVAQKIVTVILVTTEKIGSGHILSNISADCNQSEPSGNFPITVYEVVAS